MILPILFMLPAAVLTNPLIDHAVLYKRATGATVTIPQATPTGTACTSTGSSGSGGFNIPNSEFEKATAGCTGVQAFGTNFTRNEILDGICKPFTLIFARGTLEDPNMGNLVGPPLVYALNATFGTENVAVQGVNHYPADEAGYCAGGSRSGSEELAALIKKTASQCPQTKLSVAGYSQGCQVVHNAFQILKDDCEATDFVNSVLLFGDPDIGLPLGNVPAYKVSTDCHTGDDICEDGEKVLEPHLSYCQDMALQASFARARSMACA